MTHPPRICLLLSCWLTGFACLAQPISPDPDSTLHIPRKPHWVVKSALITLLEPSSTIEFGLERVITARQSIQVQFGYGWQALSAWKRSTHYRDFETWRARIEWRHYWRTGRAPFGLYTTIDGFYKRENAVEIGATVAQSPVMAGRPVSKHILGGNLKIGWQFPISDDGRLVGDVYGGLGFKARRIQEADSPPGFISDSPDIRFIDLDLGPFAQPNNVNAVSIALGFKVGYVF